MNQSLKNFGGVVKRVNTDLFKQFYQLSYKQYAVCSMSVLMTFMVSITLGCATAKPPHAVPPVYQPTAQDMSTPADISHEANAITQASYSSSSQEASSHPSIESQTALIGDSDPIEPQMAYAQKVQKQTHEMQPSTSLALTSEQAAYENMSDSVKTALTGSDKTDVTDVTDVLASQLADQNTDLDNADLNNTNFNNPHRNNTDLKHKTQDNPNKLLLSTQPDVSAALLKNARQHSGRQTVPTVDAVYAKESLPAFRRLLNQGIQQLKNDQLSAAQDSFTQAQRIAPQSSKVYFYLGKIALNKQQPTKAEAMARRGLLVANNRAAKYALWQIILTSGEMRDNVSSMNEAKSALAVLRQ